VEWYGRVEGRVAGRVAGRVEGWKVEDGRVAKWKDGQEGRTGKMG
jgi:hypothetical protein